MIVRSSLYFLALSLIVGQTIRLPVFGQSGGLLISDIAVIAVLILAIIRYCVSGNRNRHTSYYVLLTTPFILWSLVALILQAGQLTPLELVVAGSYWIRTGSYLLLLPALLCMVYDQASFQALRRSFIVTTLCLVGLGAAQLLLWPRLAALPALLVFTTSGGWDPHEGRLVSTWLDPNFIGAFLSIALVSVLALWHLSLIHI